MPKLLNFLVCLFFFLLGCNISACGQSQDTGWTNQSITSKAWILIDKNRSMKIDAVVGPKGQALFQRKRSERINLGYIDAAVWLKIDMAPLLTSPKWNWYVQLEHQNVDIVDFYQQLEGQKTVHFRSGDRLPFEQRPVPFARSTFPVESSQDGMNTIYLRIATQGSMQIAVNLLSSIGLAEEENTNQLVRGLFFGTLLSFILYHLFYFFLARDRILLWYVFYLSSQFFFIFSLSGMAYKYLWPHSISWDNIADLVFGGLVSVSGLMHSKLFLKLNKNEHPLLCRIFNVFIVLSCAVAIFPFFGSYLISDMLVSSVTVINCAIILSAGIYVSLIESYQPARYFLIAWATVLIAAILFILNQYSFLPTNFITIHGIELGIVIQVILLSLAQADHVNGLKNEIAELLAEKSRELKEVKEELKEKYTKSRLDDDTLDRMAERLIQYLEKETPYRDGSITLNKLAKNISIPTHYLSQVLNLRLEKTFHELLNEYRLREVKEKLKDPTYESNSIIDIAYEAGFNSKSAFNTLFKKTEGQTPSLYRQTRISK